MNINLDALTYEQLLVLNEAVVARIKALRTVQQQMQVMTFRVCERVAFHPDGHAPQEGVITRCNVKTVTVATDSGVIWRVAPMHLQRIATVTPAGPRTAATPSTPVATSQQLPLLPDAPRPDHTAS